jgi:peptidoglycan/xylan/chitin deacetylase (PgdA/CDA1 family)
VLATLAVLSPIAIAASPAPHPRAEERAALTRAPTGVALAGQRLFRPLGCRSGGGPYRHGPSRREVAIGFDDGPSRETGAFIRMLERNQARATFFLVGREVTGAYRAELLRELRDGDALGDHTFTHPYLTASPDVRGQLVRTLAAIRAQTGYTPCVFRPPYGVYDSRVIAVAHSLGLATALWSVDPSDYRRPGVGAIVRRVLAVLNATNRL